jgi:hypothetical protein
MCDRLLAVIRYARQMCPALGVATVVAISSTRAPLGQMCPALGVATVVAISSTRAPLGQMWPAVGV